MEKHFGGKEALTYRGKGTRSEPLLGGGQDRVVPGVATLDICPTQSPRCEVHMP